MQGVHEVSIPWLCLGCALTLVTPSMQGIHEVSVPWLCLLPWRRAYFGNALNSGRSWSKHPFALPWMCAYFGNTLNAGCSWSKRPLALPWMCAYFGNTPLLRCYPTRCWVCGNILLANTKDFSFSFIFLDILFPLFYFWGDFSILAEINFQPITPNATYPNIPAQHFIFNFVT